MNVQPMAAVYGATNLNIPLIEKRGFRAVESKHIDGTKKINTALTECALYDRLGQITYGKQFTFEVVAP